MKNLDSVLAAYLAVWAIFLVTISRCRGGWRSCKMKSSA
jgi:hypothetical protein